MFAEPLVWVMAGAFVIGGGGAYLIERRPVRRSWLLIGWIVLPFLLWAVTAFGCIAVSSDAAARGGRCVAPGMALFPLALYVFPCWLAGIVIAIIAARLRDRPA